MSRTKRRDIRPFSQKFWEDRQGNFVVWQRPNKFLWIWLVTMVAGWVLPYGNISRIVGWISLIALVAWALLEATRGVNYFRRTLGILILLLLIVARIGIF